MEFIPNKQMDVVLLGEPFSDAVPVLPNSVRKIASYAGIKRPVTLARN